MRLKRHLTRGTVALAITALALAGCSSSSDDAENGGGDTSAEAGEDFDTDCGDNAPVATPGPVSTDPLKIGTLLPATGSLAFLGPPEFAGVALAIQEINEAGGVLGSPVEEVRGDSGDDTTDTANVTVDRFLGEGTQVIVGAASSAVSLNVIDKVVNSGTVMFSPANTSDQFICYPDQGLYFRTAPTDILQAQALAQMISEDGVQRVSILARNEAYGTGLAENTKEQLQEAGIPEDAIQTVIYDPNAQSYNAEIDEVADFQPEGVAVIGFDESARIITRMNEIGIGPNEVPVYGTDGNMGNALGEAVDTGLLEGMKGTTPATELSGDFEERLRAIDPSLSDTNYAGESYDAVVISALAAEIAESTNGAAIASEINGVTRDGTKCTTFQECLDLIRAGEDIDYDGITGELEFSTPGEPTIGSYARLVFDAENVMDTDGYIVVRTE